MIASPPAADTGRGPVEGHVDGSPRHFGVAARTRARGKPQDARDEPRSTSDTSDITIADGRMLRRVRAAAAREGRAERSHTATLVQLVLPLELAGLADVGSAAAGATRGDDNRGNPRLRGRGLPRTLTDEARAWVEESSARQGIPVKVRDPLVLRKVAVLLGLEPTPPATRATPA